MAKLIITRGLMASGKTTFALALRDEMLAAGQPVARVNRDSLRRLFHGKPLYTDEAEQQITVAHQAQVRALLRSGVSVIADDTNLPASAVKGWQKLAAQVGAELVIRDEFLEVPVDECVRRDALREGHDQVGEEFIQKTFDRYLKQAKGKRLPIPELPTAPVAEQYVAPAVAPSIVLVDLDGTMCLHEGRRSPYDETLVGGDAPNMPVRSAVLAMVHAGHRVVFMSGRSEGCREATEKWLAEHYPYAYEGLFMRAAGDGRDDAVVKLELFNAHVRDRYRVAAVFDDRDRVVRMWRSLGLTVFQVADGDF
ncbi:putative kinase [Micromonospora pisi]|uniref:Putative kinase n=1 Tax=Micromonospora pisi TaxID=589240 RepID=A0A495JWT8_9ACTN|nr:AAA family ATPase [Micromonospora pisi]RKR92639.1 putative kinase [Micromonospora pisi]